MRYMVCTKEANLVYQGCTRGWVQQYSSVCIQTQTRAVRPKGLVGQVGLLRWLGEL